MPKTVAQPPDQTPCCDHTAALAAIISRMDTLLDMADLAFSAGQRSEREAILGTRPRNRPARSGSAPHLRTVTA